MAKKIYDKINEILFEKPSYKFHLREIARLAGVHPNSAKSAAVKLKKEGIAIVEKKKHITEISADMKNQGFAKKKRVFNFKKIYDSGIIEYLSEKLAPESISVIGSYSKGEDIESSDIDIVVLGSLKKPENIDISEFEKMLKRKIHLLTASYKEISDEFFTNLINGMLLYGYLRKK